MARKLRLEFPGACCHVINRGNYRSNIFDSHGARLAFQQCLFEACRRAGWLLHAFAVMSNHFHLLIETPRPTLVRGMHWLESTYANRFNRFRGESGHLFQGRYKAILVEPGEACGLVCDYINLNPVRAGMVTLGQLGGYRYGSYWYLLRPHLRPEFMRLDTPLWAAGELPDSPAGRRAYAEYLSWQLTAGPLSDCALADGLERGWVLGTSEFISELLREHTPSTEVRAWEQGGAREVREARWSELLEQCLRCVGRDSAAAARDLKSADWKGATALFLKERTLVDNRWLAEHLQMGAPHALATLTNETRRSRPGFVAAYQRLLEGFGPKPPEKERKT